MFGFYMQDKGDKDYKAHKDHKAHKDYEVHKDDVSDGNSSAMKHSAETVKPVETITDTAADTADDTSGKEATSHEGFGFLGRFATDKDYQRQVVKHYVCFPETRDYLNQIKNCRQRIELLMKRQSYRSSVNMDITDIGIEITEEEQKLARLRAEVSDEISKLNDVRQELVLTKRYVDGMSWEQIAADMCSSIRAVQSIHGRGLPAMEEVLVSDGKIALSEDGEGYGHREHYSNHRHSQKYWQKTYRHPEAHSEYSDKGYEEAADKSREPYGEYEDYEFFSD